MNPQLDRRLGRIWIKVQKRLSMKEVDKFRNAAVRAKDFDDLAEDYKNLVLEIESDSARPNF